MIRICLCISLVFVSCVSMAGDWNFVRPFPQGNTYWDAASDGNGKIYMVGDAGTVTVFDGSNFEELNPPTQKALLGISILSPTDIWIAGGDSYAEDSSQKPVILHYDGQNWTEHAGPTLLDSSYVCNDIYAAAANDVWVVIDLGTYLWHYDGNTWDWYTSIPLEVYGNFYSLFGFGSNDFYAAGTHGQIIHYDNGTWILENQEENPNPTFTTNLLFAVWGLDPENVFAAGNYGQAYKRDSSSGTWNSITSWTGSTPQFDAIWGSTATDVYFSGDGFYNYNGIGFTKINTENLGDAMYGISPSPDNNSEIVVGIDGKVWWHKNNMLNPLTISSTQDTYEGGPPGVPYGQDSLLVGDGYIHGRQHYLNVLDGNSFKPFTPLPMVYSDVLTVNYLTARDDNNIWISLLGNNMLNYTYHWDGAKWNQFPYNYSTNRIWPLENGEMYYINNSRMFHYHDTMSSIIGYATGTLDIFGRSDNDIFMVGESGAAYHFDGANINIEQTGTQINLTAAAGDEDEVYAVGENRVALYRDQSGWKPVKGLATRDENHFTGIISAGGNVFYAVLRTPQQYIGGDRGEIYKFQNGEFVEVQSGLSNYIYAMGKMRNGDVLGWGSSGLLMKVIGSGGAENEYASVIDPGTSLDQSLGNTGITLHYPNDDSGVQLVQAQSFNWQPEDLADEIVSVADHYWMLTSSIENVTATIEFDYDPTDLSFAEAQASLYRGTADGWEEIASSVFPDTDTITTQNPTQFSNWAIGINFLPGDLDQDGDVDAQDLMIFSKAWMTQQENSK